MADAGGRGTERLAVDARGSVTSRRMRQLIENASDVADYDRAVAADDGVRIPMTVAVAIADGARPVRAWRQHRGMTQEQLSVASGVSKPYISQLESGARAGTPATLRKLARALDIPVGALIEE